ncbi:MAG: hypothetical protein ACJAZX_001664, partial [Rickettsiales bacterium]
MTHQNPINPIFQLKFSDLYQLDGLCKIDKFFDDFLKDQNLDLHTKYCAAKENPESLNSKQESDLLIETGKILEEFLALFFDIQKANSDLQNEHSKLANLFVAKRLFVQRRVSKKFKSFDEEINQIPQNKFDELEL